MQRTRASSRVNRKKKNIQRAIVKWIRNKCCPWSGYYILLFTFSDALCVISSVFGSSLIFCCCNRYRVIFFFNRCIGRVNRIFHEITAKFGVKKAYELNVVVLVRNEWENIVVFRQKKNRCFFRLMWYIYNLLKLTNLSHPFMLMRFQSILYAKTNKWSPALWSISPVITFKSLYQISFYMHRII